MNASVINDNDNEPALISTGEFLIFLSDEEAEGLKNKLKENPECEIKLNGPISDDEWEE